MRSCKGWLAAVAIVLAAGWAQAGDQDFRLVNKTGVEIYALYVSPSHQNSWGVDILGEETLPDGQTAAITFDPSEEAELWDVKVEDSDGNAIVWTQLNLMTISTLTLHYNAETEEATATSD